MAAAAVVAAGIAVYGDIKSSNDQAQLDAERANIAGQQSKELGDREASNEAVRNQLAMRQKLQFGSSYAASGKAGVGLGSQLQIQNQTDLQNMTSNRETMFQQQMLQEQAGIDTSLGSQALTAGTVSAVGAGVGGLASAARIGTAGGANPGYGGTQSAGAYGGG